MNLLFYIDLSITDDALHSGLKIIASQLPISFKPKKKTISIKLVHQKSNNLDIQYKNNIATIHYGNPNIAFRGLSVLFGKILSKQKWQVYKEQQKITMINVMLDTSRNAVMKVDTLKTFLTHLALMGINHFMLYMESNFEIPGEPYHGYNLGKYTLKELKEVDSFAKNLHIELIPCIQTLAHLKRTLQWETYANIKDTKTVLLIDEKSTYDFLEKMLSTLSNTFSSRKIHIGMDEAWDVGLGTYLKKNGYKEPFELMKLHLDKVLDIIRKLKLSPMMWGDMFFRAGSKTGAYYDDEAIIPEKVSNALPSDVEIIYWDYYHSEVATYEKWLDRHLKLSTKVGMATGAHTWNRLFCTLPSSFKVIDSSMQTNKKRNLNHVILTLWGDDGNECDYFSSLPALQYYADHCYNDTPNLKEFSNTLFASCKINYHKWEPAGQLDYPKNINPIQLENNISKILLWEDILYGIAQNHIKNSLSPYHFSDIYKSLKSLQKIKFKKPFIDYRVLVPMQLAKVLSIKWDLPTRIKQAYQKKDNLQLRKILKKDLPFLAKEIKLLSRYHQEVWHMNNKPQGWEVIGARYGGLLQRIKLVQEKLKKYLHKSKTTTQHHFKIEELEEKTLKIHNLDKGIYPIFFHKQIYSGTLTPTN